MTERRFFVAEYEGKLFLGNTFGDEFAFAALRDAGSERRLEGTMHRTREEAEAEALRAQGPFEGPFIAVVDLREVTRDEAMELGAKMSSSPDTYAEAFRRTF